MVKCAMGKAEDQVWDYVSRSALALAENTAGHGLSDLCKNLSNSNLVRLARVAGLIYTSSQREVDQRRHDLAKNDLE